VIERKQKAVGRILPVRSTRGLEISRGRPRGARIILEKADCGIAFAAKEAAHLAGRMTVIDAQRPARVLLADGANTSLPFQYRVVVSNGYSISAQELVLALVLEPLLYPLPVFRTLPALTAARVDLLFVRGPIRAIPLDVSLAKLGVFSIPFLEPLELRKHVDPAPISCRSARSDGFTQQHPLLAMSAGDTKPANVVESRARSDSGLARVSDGFRLARPA